MAAHSSTPAWRIPWTEEAGGLQSMGSQRAGHDWATERSKHSKLHSIVKIVIADSVVILALCFTGDREQGVAFSIPSPRNLLDLTGAGM